MNFKEAFEFLFIDGKKIRRKEWGEGYHLYPTQGHFVKHPIYPCYGNPEPAEETDFYCVKDEDFFAMDWEIYDEE